MELNSLRRHLTVMLLLLTCCTVAGSGSQVARPSPTNPYGEAIAASRAAIQEMMKRATVPGVGVAVAVDGEVAWAEGFGFADLEQRVPVTHETKFGIGSITKSMTMALYGRLAEEGIVSLDTPVENSLPDFPHKSMKISVRLIAGHLSGLDDSVSTVNTYTTTHYNTTSDALQLLLKEQLKYKPLERHFYTTGPYTFIAGVVEKAAGIDFPTLMNRYVINPLGLKNTVPNDRKTIIMDRTSFYVKEGDGNVNAPYFDPSFKLAGAGYLSTAEDMARFGSAFLRPGFLKQATVDELFRPLRTSAGEDTGFGLGWRIGVDKKSRPIIHQPGGGPGISCWLVLYPKEKVVIVILSNQTGAPVGGRALDTISDSFITARPQPISSLSLWRSAQRSGCDVAAIGILLMCRS